MSNEIQVLVTDAWFGKPQADAGKARLLAITSDRANPAYPGVPTVSASGGPPFESKIWFGFFAPARTPDAIVKELNAAIVAGLELPAVKERLQAQGLMVEATTSEAFRTFLAREVERWNTAVDRARVTRE